MTADIRLQTTGQPMPDPEDFVRREARVLALPGRHPL